MIAKIEFVIIIILSIMYLSSKTNRGRRGIRYINSIVSHFNKNWDEEAFYHSFWHVLGALGAFFIVGLFCIVSPKGHLYEFLKGGDFCLFSAAILTPGAYSLSSYSKHNNIKDRKITLPRFVTTISVVLIVISALLFSWVYIHSVIPECPINEDLIVICSIVFLIFSVMVFYYSKLLEERLKTVDYARSSNEDFDNFESDFENK
jgi:hypothetical protein